jgi:hypothetical protein
MFEEGFKRYDNVTIIAVFGEAMKGDASITYRTIDDKMPRFALIRTTNLESYTTIEGDCSVKGHKDLDFKDSNAYLESILQQFATALKENITVNLVIAIIKKGTNKEFVARAEFL